MTHAFPARRVSDLVAACGTRARLDGGQFVSRRIWCCPSGARPVVHAVGLSWGNRHAPTVDHLRDLGAHRDFRTGSIVDCRPAPVTAEIWGESWLERECP